MNFRQAETHLLQRLETALSPTLYYHGLHHTLDVVQAAEWLADRQGLTDPTERGLLRTAALYHDCGFTDVYQGHEEEGCRYVRAVLPGFGFLDAALDAICGMIRATKIPQQPQTKLEEILADADLDYLGRDDFEPIARTLFEELKVRNLVADEPAWNRIQVKFLESHHYWTPTAVAERQASKQRHLDQLRELVQSYSF
jgi:predicted metal-dependent HD superfamily phosphohydrolase